MNWFMDQEGRNWKSIIFAMLKAILQPIPGFNIFLAKSCPYNICRFSTVVGSLLFVENNLPFSRPVKICEK